MRTRHGSKVVTVVLSWETPPEIEHFRLCYCDHCSM